MLLVMHIGNYAISLGVYKNEKLVLNSGISTDRGRFPAQYAAELQSLFRFYEIDGVIDGAIICSVVPELTGTLCGAIELAFKIRPVTVSPGIKTGLNIKTDNPAQVGADLVATAVGAIAKHGAPCVIYSLSEVTTVSVIDFDGAFRGGAICAGVRLSVESLEANTALLPNVELEPSRELIGRNTADSMKSGAFFGAACLIDGFGTRLSEQFPGCAHIVTGLYAKAVSPLCRLDVTMNEFLIFEGLLAIYKKNVVS